MPLSVGAKLGPYEIVAPIGAGGMGEVYRARDTNLDRDVAVKVLPAGLAQDPDRLARFKREAKVLASLNHPHIAQIYDVEDAAMIMELVKGGAPQGPLPMETALLYARQIAEALEAAHEKGVVHRDLKPANIKVTPEGVVKVLDFGLAALAPSSAMDSDPTKSPTMTLAATHAGTVLGTAAYMSPEQAAGKAADKRADIWSFGVVLFELLTGKRLFEGETVSHTLAGVLAGPIDFERLPRGTPAAIRTLLRRCLERNAKNRLRDIGEARVAIEASLAGEAAETVVPLPPRRSPVSWVAVAAVFALAFGALAWVHFGETTRQRQRFKSQIAPPAGELGSFKISPDGRFLAIVTEEGSTGLKIWIRSLDGLDTRLLTDVQGLRNFTLFWSWDGEQLAYQSGDKLYKIARIGGPPVFLADAPEQIQRGVWMDGGIILFGTASGLFRVSSSGGAPVKLDDQASESPAWLPNGRFLYVRAGGIFAGSLSGGRPVAILPERAAATYVLPLKAGLPGQLLFIRRETLLAQPFDAEKLALQGDAVPVEECGSKPSAGGVAFTASTNGVLVCRGGNPPDVVLTWLDRAGKKLRSVGKPFRLAINPAIRLSPDDSQAIVTISGPTGVDLWIADLNRETLSRFTFEGSRSALWSPDGRRVVWAANDRNRYLKSADGSGKDELLYQDPKCNSCYLEDWSADGKLIAFAESGEKAALDIWLVPVNGDRKPYPYLQSRFATYWAQISPDSRWMAYGSDQSPHPQQVLVASIPTGKGSWQISTEGGDWPIWRRDGKELFYRQGTKLMAVPIRLTETTVDSGEPQVLFEVPSTARFQVSRDGRRFLFALPVEGASAFTPLIVDSDWRVGLVK
jgi:Tol biopolymer transport system component